jgi:hypothetical protein
VKVGHRGPAVSFAWVLRVRLKCLGVDDPSEHETAEASIRRCTRSFDPRAGLEA